MFDSQNEIKKGRVGGGVRIIDYEKVLSRRHGGGANTTRPSSGLGAVRWHYVCSENERKTLESLAKVVAVAAL